MKICVRNIFLVIVSFFLAHCAGKPPPPMKDESIATVQKLRVGVIDLNQHDLNDSKLYNCAQNYSSINMISGGVTEKEIESAGYSKNSLIESLRNQDFVAYQNVKNFSVLLLLFKNNQNQNYIRIVNFLTKSLRTLALTPEQLSCENIFTTARMLSIDSHPAFADVYLDDRFIGAAPLWTSLKDGSYDVECKLPDNVFPSAPLKIPGTTQYLCQRENANTTSSSSNDETPTMGEKSQAVFIYLLIGALAIAGAVIPIISF